jgi:hypothetical protein
MVYHTEGAAEGRHDRPEDEEGKEGANPGNEEINHEAPPGWRGGPR